MQWKTVLHALFFFFFFTACNDTNRSLKQSAADSSAPLRPGNNADTTSSKEPMADSLRENLVQQLVRSNEYNQALQHIEVLLKKNPLSPAWLFMKADALEKKGDTTGAISAYEQSIQSAGLFPEAQMRLAALFAETGNKNAVQLCDGLLKEPTAVRMRSDILFVKAVYYNKIKDTKNALRIYDQIIKEDYTYLDAYIEKGLVYYDMGNFVRAHQLFQQSTDISNKFADGYFWMAKTEEKMNQQQEAIDNYKRSLALDQSVTEARNALKRLGALK